MKRMLEVFSGSGRMAAAFHKRGWVAKTIDLFCPADLNADVRSITRKQIVELCGGEPDFIWFSPPCTAFSVASISTHWTGGWRAYIPKSETAKLGLELMRASQRIINWFPNALWMWENPRGVMRKIPMMKHKLRHTVTFCQYGEERMKPTDIWTNVKQWRPRPMCKNRAPCHVAAPRGSKTGTQGLKNAYERAKLPFQLCDEIADLIINLKRR